MAAINISAETQLEFLHLVRNLLDEGRFTSTYKFALLMALAAASVEEANSPSATLELPLTRLAERVIAYSWRQSRPFVGHAGQQGQLKQNNGPQAAILTLLGNAQGQYSTLARLQADTSEWHSVRARVASILREMPVRHMHGSGTDEAFLFTLLSARRSIEIPARTVYCLRSLYQPIQMMVETAWIRWIKQQHTNNTLLGETADLESFLFGTERGALERTRPAYRELQQGMCFYCFGRLKDSGEIDHFIPWSRYPLDDGFNLVLAHSGCNRDKRALLSAKAHLANWARRNEDLQTDIEHLSRRAGLTAMPSRAVQVARWAYAQVEQTQAETWRARGDTEPLPRSWPEELPLAAN